MTEEVAPTGCTTQGSLGMPVGVTVDLRTASLLSGLYGVTGAIAAVLLLPLIAARTEVQLPVPTPVFAALLAVQLMVIYALLGWAGLRMARRRGLDPAPTLTKLWQGLGVRIGWRGMAAGAVGGLISGAALVLAIKIITRVLPGTLPAMLHPPSAASALAASTAAALGEEILCRLLLLSLVLRLLPPGARWGCAAANVISALAFGVLHWPGMVALFGGLSGVPALAWVWFVLLNALVGVVFGALYLRHGIGAAIAGHWFCDLVWHVGSVLA